MKYKTLKDLKAAYDSGKLSRKHKLMLDNDDTFVYGGDDDTIFRLVTLGSDALQAQEITDAQIARATDAYNNACAGANAMEYDQRDCMEFALKAVYTHPSPSTAALREALDRTQRRVVCAAIKLGDGRLVIGPRHWDKTMHTACPLEQRKAVSFDKETQGFIDQHGVFMDRREAWKIADAAGQILFRCGGDGERLFSENLY